jgi:hypothetical protein
MPIDIAGSQPRPSVVAYIKVLLVKASYGNKQLVVAVRNNRPFWLCLNLTVPSRRPFAELIRP